MTEKDNKQASKTSPTMWSALAVYMAAGWAAAEVLLATRERFGLPEALDNIVLGLLVAGLAAVGLRFVTGTLAKRSPLLSVARILTIAVVAASIALGVSAWLGQSKQGSDIPSVAVLPCEYKGAEDYAFLGPATAQEVHARLARVHGIQIPAWRSVLRSLELGSGVREVADILQVKHLARCQVVRRDDGFELSAEIVTPATDEPIWSGRYSYASTDLITALGDLSLAIVDALSARLTAEESDRLGTPTSNPEAYELYLRARHRVSAGLAISREQFEAAMKEYQAAVDLDPDFAAAWAGMAMLIAHFDENPGQFGDDTRTADEQSKALAQYALSLDPCTVEALFIIAPLADDTDPSDQVYQTGPSWADIYHQRMELIQRAIDCEPQNATAWLQMMFFYTYFPLWPNTGTEYPAEQARAALKMAYRLDPTNCWLAGIRITMLRSEFWAPRPEDVMSRDELKDTLRAALLVDPTCGFMYDILEAVNVSEERLDEAIAWKMAYHDLAPHDPAIGCRIAELFLELGLVEQARNWAARSDWPGCLTEADIDCRQSRESYYSESCQADRVKKARWAVESDFATINRIAVPIKYREALYLVGDTDRLDLARQWLGEGLEAVGTDDPVALLNKNPKRLNSARHQGLSLVPIFRDLGLTEAADRLLEMCRRDPSDPAQITFGMKGQYLDARHRSLAGQKEEAMALLTRAVREHQMWSLILDWPSPDRSDLMFDRALDPLRDDPRYAPQLEQLIEEYDSWLAPARERAARAAETGNWAALRTFLDDN